MPYIARDFYVILNSSGSSPATAWTSRIDDAASITVCLTSSSGVLSSNCSIQVTPWDPLDPLPSPTTTGPVTSTMIYSLVVGSSVALSSGGQAFTLSNISFRAFRIATSSNTLTTGTIIAYATKQITV